MAKYSEAEIKALNYKAMHKSEEVLCPRCGKPLEFRDYRCGYVVACSTPECLKETVRGI